MKMRQGCELAVLGLALMCVVGATPSEEAIPRKRKTLASIDKSWAFLLETHNSSVPLGGISKDGTVGRRQLNHGYNVDGTPPASFIVGEIADCGGCKFLRDINGTLSKGDPGCGGSCYTLDLTYQGITSIAPGTFSSMTGMNVLLLAYNMLTSLPDDIFNGLSLNAIILEYNQISSLTAGTFRGITLGSYGTFSIYMSHNRLTDIDDGAFDHDFKLERCDLSSNLLTSYPAAALANQDKLEILDLSDNRITSLPEGLGFPTNNELASIDLGSNMISLLTAGMLRGLANLQQLYLYNNSIASLPEDVFSLMRSDWFTTLELQDNQLAFFDVSILDGFSRLYNLNLNGNNLTTLGGFDGFFELIGLNLGNNPWRCKARIPCYVQLARAGYGNGGSWDTHAYFRLPDCTATGLRRTHSHSQPRSARVQVVAHGQMDGESAVAELSMPNRKRGFVLGPPSHPVLFYNLDDVFEPMAPKANIRAEPEVSTRRQTSNIQFFNLPPAVSDLRELETVFVRDAVHASNTTLVLSGVAVLSPGDYIMSGYTPVDAISTSEIMRVISSTIDAYKGTETVTVERGFNSTTAISIASNTKVYKIISSLSSYPVGQIHECGSCTWHRDANGVLSKQGPIGCGSDCWELDLSNQGITSIESDAFRGTRLNESLHALYLHDNHMTSLTEGIFDGLFWQDPYYDMYDAVLDLGGNPWQCSISIPCIISSPMGPGHYKISGSWGFFFEWNVRSYRRLPDCPSNSHRRSDSEASYSPSRQLPASGRPLTVFSNAAIETERVPYSPGSMGFGIAENILTPRKVVYYSDETGDTVVDLDKFKSQDAAPPARRQSGQTMIFSCGGCTWYTDDDGVLSMEGGSSGCGESCHYLDMRNKGITSIAPGAFNSTGLLTGAWKSLNLYGNQIAKLPDGGVFDGLQIYSLDLGNNNLTNLNASSFRGMIILQYLNLNGNQISSVPSHFFKDFGSVLRSIDLGNNNISSLSYDFLDGLNGAVLESLYLYNNLLTNLPAGFLDGFRSIAHLDLQGNPWTCKVSIPCFKCPFSEMSHGMMKEYGHIEWIGHSGYGRPWDVEAYLVLPACGVQSLSQPGIPPGVTACEKENRTMKEIVLGMREEGFFQGGMGGMSNGTWTTWGCWRKHACLDSIGLANQGEAVCYKRNSADGSWMLWGLQREVGVGCSDGWNGTANAPLANFTR